MMAGPAGLRNKDNYVIIGDQAYGKYEAIYKALQDLNYFQEHGKHLPALKYSTIPPGNIDPLRYREIYPDITKKVNKVLEDITRETVLTFHSTGKAGVYHLFYKNFPNNGKWDLQVGYGLPGQVPVIDPSTGELQPDTKHKGRYLTTDQYAIFNHKVVRSGYLSNYAFGQAVAAGEMFNFEGTAAAQAVAFLGNLKNLNLKNITANFDNPEDIQAILDGYLDYNRMHPMQYPTPGSFRNK